MEDVVVLKKARKEGYDSFVLGADIGGTLSRFAIAGIKRGGPEMIFYLEKKTWEMDSVIPPVREILGVSRRHGIRPSKICIGVAGPLSLDRSEAWTTNADLVIRARDITKAAPMSSVMLLNDFEATGFGVNVLGRRDVERIKKGKGKSSSRIVVIGAGTGLGKSVLVYDKRKGLYLPLPSEGGHTDFPIQDDAEFELVSFIRRYRNIRNVSYEEVLSGRGLEAIYYFLKRKGLKSSHNNEIEMSSDVPETISRFRKKDKLCRETFRLWARFYARCARNSALDCLALSGVYLAGGITAKNIDILKSREFVREFEGSDKMGMLLRDIPVYAVKRQDLGLLGALFAAYRMKDISGEI